MTRKLLIIAILSAGVFSISGAKAAPTMNTLETLKPEASAGKLIQEARYRHRRSYRHVKKNCWWGDRWLCRYLW